MKPSLVSFLSCVACAGKLSVADGEGRNLPEGIVDEVREGWLVCRACSRRVPIQGGIPRFIASDGYVSNFSFEWTRFSTTQLDSARGWRLSEERFSQSLNFPLEDLQGKVVLDAGCGMGRFAEIAAKHGATVIAVDLSFAVDAAARNLERWKRAHVVQADLRQLPLRREAFDFIYSLGVLHHTPAPRATFEGLLPLLKPGGKISISLYSRYNKVYVTSTDLWRRLTTRLPSRLVYYLSHLAIPLYYLYKVPVLGLVGQGLWPISMHPDPEWRLLDTFDCYTPKYQFFHTHPEVYQWFRQAGLEDIATLELGVSMVARRPTAGTPTQRVTMPQGVVAQG